MIVNVCYTLLLYFYPSGKESKVTPWNEIEFVQLSSARPSIQSRDWLLDEQIDLFFLSLSPAHTNRRLIWGNRLDWEKNCPDSWYHYQPFKRFAERSESTEKPLSARSNNFLAICRRWTVKALSPRFLSRPITMG